MTQSMSMIGMLGLFISLSFSFLPPPNEPIERPLETWVFRAVLDEQPGALIAALHEDIWIAYDPSSGSLFRAWRGTVKVMGAAYSGQLGGQPITDGFVFHEANPQTSHWTIRHKRGDETPKVVFRGYRILENHLTLSYDLVLRDGRVILVEEQPEYRPRKDNNRMPIERVFRLANVPEDVEVLLNLEIDNLLVKSDIKSNGKVKIKDAEKRMFEWGNVFSLQAELPLDPSEPTEVTTIFTLDLESGAKKRGG